MWVCCGVFGHCGWGDSLGSVSRLLGKKGKSVNISSECFSVNILQKITGVTTPCTIRLWASLKTRFVTATDTSGGNNVGFEVVRLQGHTKWISLEDPDVNKIHHVSLNTRLLHNWTNEDILGQFVSQLLVSPLSRVLDVHILFAYILFTNQALSF